VATELPLDLLDPGPYQFRDAADLEAAALAELRESIRLHGVLQAIQVRPGREGRYEIVYGHRRTRAARRAGLKMIPARIRPMDDWEAFQLAFSENADRQDISAMARARMFEAWLTRTGKRQTDLAGIIKRSTAYVNQYLRILSLPESVQAQFTRVNFPLTERHAREIVRLETPAEQEALAQRIVAEELSVGRTHALVDELLQPQPPKPRGAGRPKAPPPSPLVAALRAAGRLARNVSEQAQEDAELGAALEELTAAAERVRERLKVLAEG
jgi:ParB family chromosome partitioning protein